MSAKDLAAIDPEEFKSFLDSFDNVLCDLDGVIWRTGNSIPGVSETLSKLRELGKKVRFVSNNCTNTLESFVFKLNKFQMNVKAEDIIFPTLAIIDYLKKMNFDKEIYVLASPPMVEEFVKAGFTVRTMEHETFSSLEEFRRHLDDDMEVGAVVAELDVNVSYLKLVKAIVHLRRPEVLYITGGDDYQIPGGSRNIFFPGPRHFQVIIEDLTKRVPIMMGKPEKHLNNFIVQKFNITDPARTLFVGDSLKQDIGFATNNGYGKLLTLSGLSSLDDLQRCQKQEWIPEYYIRSLGDLHKLIKDKLDL